MFKSVLEKPEKFKDFFISFFNRCQTLTSITKFYLNAYWVRRKQTSGLIASWHNKTE